MKRLCKIFSLFLALTLVLGIFTAMPLSVQAIYGETEYKSGDYKYLVRHDEAVIIGYTGSSKSVTIPATLGGYKVTVLGDDADGYGSAIEGFQKITSLTIGNNVRRISASAFSTYRAWGSTEKSELVSLKIEKGVVSISSSFAGCTKLKNIEIPDSVIDMSSYAFKDTAWYNAQPNGVVYIGKIAYGYKGNIPKNYTLNIKKGTLGIAHDAFSFQNITNINIPDSVCYIGRRPFRNTSWEQKQKGPVYLGKVFYRYYGTIPKEYKIKEGTLGIAEEAFFDDEYAYYPNSKSSANLIKITLPNGLKTIGADAFVNCYRLLNITVPKSVTYIGDYAYGFCHCGKSVPIKSPDRDKTTINGYTGNVAERYAKSNYIKFNSLGFDDQHNRSVTLGKGESYSFTEGPNSGLKTSNFKWSSTNTSIATIANASGNKATIKATGIGTAYVNIMLYNGRTALCKVTVKPAPASVKTNPASVTLGVGETYTISESTDSGSYANAANLNWSSSNNSVATVTKGIGNKATIKATGVGTAYVKIMLYNGKTAQCKVTVKSAPASVTTNPTSLILGKGESYVISENTNSGSYANAANLKWSSSNNSVATVTKGSGNKATIKATGVGTAYVKIMLYNGKTAQCKVTVKSAPVSVITNPTSVTLGKGETYTISESTNSGAYANAANLKWSSSNNSVATVTKGSGNKATIKATGVGTAYVKITLYNGKTAQCKVTVKNAPSSVKINPTSVTLNKGESYTISESTNSGTYANAANLKWSSSNNSIATVTKGSGNKAVITAKSKGTAYVKIVLFNGKTAQCKVTVK